ncbi:hypothetical protein N7450_011780 [Penicillium hetheringtonii]|uniref:Uncharacterized protein n=1 Tax=Penicillium hetheringtonii TaxID=911720 RepID=A0AAD6DCQ7_9EURO|nr:hypothetical protein N7450_011780 [Penicillium hetheringtonii]
MAPRLPSSKLQLIQSVTHHISNGRRTRLQQIRTINIRTNLRRFENARAPPNRICRRSTVNPLMIEAFCDDLSAKPDSYLDEMIVFQLDEFHTMITISNIGRAMKARGCEVRPILNN